MRSLTPSNRQPRSFALIRTVLAFAVVFSQLLLPFSAARTALAAGSAYSLNWRAADAKVNSAPYTPTYTKVGPGALACPTSSGGRANDPMKDAVYGKPVDAVASLMPQDMALGQVVPFQLLVTVNGDVSNENGTIQIKPYWSTKTTSGNDFGFDPSYGVYCAFVDTADAANVNVGNAKVDSFGYTIANPNTSNEQIQGNIKLSGLTNGATMVVEIWVVLKSSIAVDVSGNVQTGIDKAWTGSGGEPKNPDINSGNQTVPLNQVGSFFTASADVSVVKSDNADPVTPGSTFSYSLVVKNNSTTTVANGITVVDTLNPKTTFVPASSNSGCSASGGTVTCTVGALNPGQQTTVLIGVQVANDAPTAGTIQTGTCTVGQTGVDLCNRVSVSAITSDPTLSNNSDSEPTNVQVVNRPPVASDDSVTTAEETAKTIAVLGNDSDPDNNLAPSTLKIITAPTNGTAVKNADGTITYTPDTNFSGTNSLVYEVCDSTNLCDTATVSITVSPVNDRPVAVNDSYATNEDTAVTIDAPGVLANDSDVDGDTLTVAVATQPANGTLTLNANGSFTYTPNLNYKGSDSFTYTLSDGKGGSDTATVSITVNSVNDAPKAANDSYTTGEDTKLSIFEPGLLANDSDVDSDPLTVSSFSQPDHGTLALNANGSFTYTPHSDYTGPDSFSYTVSDGKGGSDTATVSITVSPVNDLPVAVDDTTQTNEDAAVTIAVLANDSDIDGDRLTVTAVSQPANGTAAINADGSVTYTPKLDFNGQDSFTYTVSDGKGGSDTATVTIDVATVNDPPVAGDDSASTPEDQAKTIAVLANDSDVDGNLSSGSVKVVTEPANGTAVVNADATITYTPRANFNGSDSFEYQVCDTTGLCASATVSITVSPVNDAPLAVNDTYSTNEDTPLAVAKPGVLENDSDIDDDGLTVSANAAPANGTLTVNADGSLSYTPNANYNGTDSFSYTITDGKGGSATATVSIIVVSVNDMPVAQNDSYSTNEDTKLTVAARGLLTNDRDIDGDALTVSSFSQPAHGALDVNADGSLSYTPNANYHGPDSFTYTVSDGKGGVDTATVGITVNPVNDAPAALEDNVATNEDQAATIPVLANDSDVDGNLNPGSVTIVSDPKNGTTTVNAGGSVKYTPFTNYNGGDSFAYRVCDTAGLCAEATVTITVTPVNDAPVANDDSFSTDEDTPLTVAKPGALANDSDVDGDPLAAAVQSGPSHGTLALNADGSLSYTPDANYNGKDSFSYTVSDGKGGTDSATVSITVNAVNDAPVAKDDTATTPEDESVTVNVLGNDGDIDGDTLTVDAASAPAHGTVVINADGTVTYTPASDYNGTDTFEYTVSDGKGGTATATVTITISPVNDAPVAVNDSASTDEDTAATIAVRANDSDIDGDTLTVTAVSAPAHGTVVINSDGTVTYTPAADYNGGDSFTYTVSDGKGGTASATVTVGVATVNDPPVAQDDTATTPEDAPVAVGVPANDSDVDGNLNSGSVSIAVKPQHGAITINSSGTITYTPDADYNGPDRFTYQICDTGEPVFCDTATVSITVTPVNDNPMAGDDGVSVNEDDAVTGNVLANDTDVDGDTLTVNGFTLPSHGTLALNPDGTFSYTPNANYNGSDSFSYTVSDGKGGSGTATVSITVKPINDAPVANGDSYSTNEEARLTVAALGVLGNDTDLDGDALKASIVTQPTNGTMTQNADGSFSYTPNDDFNGSDSFTYQACDAAGLCDTATVSITVTPVNDAPEAVGDSYTTNEDSALTVSKQEGVLSNDKEVDGDTLTASLVTGPVNGTLTLNADGSFSYTPKPNYNGSDSFTYKACDPSGLCSQVKAAAITVSPVNDAPTAVDDSYSTSEGSPLTLQTTGGMLANDGDIDQGDRLIVTGVTQPANGTLELNNDGTFTYTPKANFSGSDSFTYTISDGNGGAATAKATITVNDVKPSITVTKTADPRAVQFTGGTVQYTVVVNNTSVEPVTMTSLADDKFGDLNKTATAKSWLSSSCVVPQTIAKGGSYTCSFTATVAGGVAVNVGGSHNNTVTAGARDNEANAITGKGSETVLLFWRGRTPGYWKNHTGAGNWPSFSVNGSAVAPSTLVTKVFAVHSSLLTNGILDLNKDGKADTLLDALSYKGGSDLGGGAQILLRAGVAGLLNEQTFGAAYPAYSSVSALISGVNAALTSGNRTTMITLANQIDYWNNGVH